MRIAIMVAVVVLAAAIGCDTAPMTTSDAGTDAQVDAGPMPECRPLSEDPTCEGDCSRGFYAACPCGFTAACASALRGWRTTDVEGVRRCVISGSRGGPYCTDAGELEPCGGDSVMRCVPDGPAFDDPLVMCPMDAPACP